MDSNAQETEMQKIHVHQSKVRKEYEIQSLLKLIIWKNELFFDENWLVSSRDTCTEIHQFSQLSRRVILFCKE